LRFSAFEIGDGEAGTLRKLLNKLDENNLKIVCTDGNQTYCEELSPNIDIQHIVTKAGTCLVESYNSVLRYYLARLQRKTRNCQLKVGWLDKMC
jgi:IS1 family transposase